MKIFSLCFGFLLCFLLLHFNCGQIPVRAVTRYKGRSKVISGSEETPSLAPAVSPNIICQQYIRCTCGDEMNLLNFNGTMHCLYNHTSALESICGPYFQEVLTGAATSCQLDIWALCSSDITTLHPFHIPVCLLHNYEYLSKGCRVQMNSLLSPFVPCTEDASHYCSDRTNLDEVVSCLSEVPSYSLEPECSSAILRIANCKLAFNSTGNSSIPCWKKKIDDSGDGNSDSRNGDNSGATDTTADPSPVSGNGTGKFLGKVVVSFTLFLFFCRSQRSVQL
jgi:hypothetical protein